MFISHEDYKRFKDLLNKKTGILLGDNKQYLVVSRLTSFLKEKGIASFSELLIQLETFAGKTLLQEVIDRMTTNETLWFRDSFPFKYLVSDILPEFKSKGIPSVSIWSAACSTGQEPYSISMAIEEVKHSLGSTLPRNVDIYATDISSRVLAQAQKGEYQSLEITRGLSPERQRMHFTESDGTYSIKPAIKKRVKFNPMNLMQLPYRHPTTFDVIFCRNVLIYFSGQLKLDVIKGMYDCLKPGGYLFLGASESMPTALSGFTMIRCNPGLAFRKDD